MSDETAALPAHKPWDQLEDEQKRQVTMLLMHLEELAEGQRLSAEWRKGDPDAISPANRFFIRSALTYFDALYCTGLGVWPVLRDLDLNAVSAKLMAIRERPVGDRTLGTFLRSHRNTGSAHLRFNPKLTLAKVYGPDDQPFASSAFDEAFEALVDATAGLMGLLRDLYPVANAWAHGHAYKPPDPDAVQTSAKPTPTEPA